MDEFFEWQLAVYSEVFNSDQFCHRGEEICIGWYVDRHDGLPYPRLYPLDLERELEISM